MFVEATKLSSTQIPHSSIKEREREREKEVKSNVRIFQIESKEQFGT
jgi:hypothetical protein